MEINVEQKIKGEVSRRNSNTSDASFAYIPEEIQIDILSRLPPKSLSRCKCVSKHWNDTLTIQAFLVSHFRSYGKHPKLWFGMISITWGSGWLISFELNDDNTPKTTIWLEGKLHIRGKEVHFTDFLIRNYAFMSNICNDLICVFYPYSTSVGLLNIKTQDFIPLPPITKTGDFYSSWYSLGFDPVHQVFKVLSISYNFISSIIMVAILTVGSNYWNPIHFKSLPSSVIKGSRKYNTGSVCIDGVIYSVYKNRINNPTVLTITAFDLNREAFRDNELVTPMRHCSFRYGFTSLKEYPTLLIWERKSYETEEVEQWTLFNHKSPNATWKRRNFNNHNIQTMLPYDPYIIYVGGGSTLLQYSEKINSDEGWYSLYDLENSQ
ncbi:putative F-box protein At5g52610 [Silene latifolia]|uniref:putative F-box protein At5g52610 n=1 Tax=Silene latifolia TaxID=37657 RepID=UPI003D776A38